MMARMSILLLWLWPAWVLADAGQENLPSVEDSIREIDTNHDGQVSITEIRAYLERKHGKGYEQELLNQMETKANASCGSPFSRSFY